MMDVALASARARPALLAGLRLALQQLRSRPHSTWWKQWDDVIAAGHDEWCRAPELARIGYELLEPRWDEDLRIWACRWLTHFPSEETVQRLAGVLADEDAPALVRSQAVFAGRRFASCARQCW